MTFVLYSTHHPNVRHVGPVQNTGPFLNVVTWILLITSTLAVFTRLITKRALRRKIDVDDAFVIAALITSIGSGIAISFQTANGLGRDIVSLPDNQIAAYQKSEYANKMLYIATLVFAKLSIISLLVILTASDIHRNLGIFVTVFIAVWGIVAELAIAFQCGSVEPWRFFERGHQCLNLVLFWRIMGIVNILTDLALIVFPVHVIVTLQMSLVKKVTILIFFGARSLDIVATAVQMTYLYGFSSVNPTQDLWKWTLVSQVILCTTILTSCIPYLRPLLEALPSGLYRSDELRRRHTISERGYSSGKWGSYLLSSNTSKGGGGTRHSRKSETQGNGKRDVPRPPTETTTNLTSASGIPGGPRRPDGEIDVEITATYHRTGEDRRWETDSTGSRTRILKTTVMTTEWEAAQRHSRDIAGNNNLYLK